jgi:hypothetical protein
MRCTYCEFEQKAAEKVLSQATKTASRVVAQILGNIPTRAEGARRLAAGRCEATAAM